MATRKTPRAASKGRAKAPVRRPARPARKRPAKPAARRTAPAPRRKQRQDPETLRLRSYEPSLTVNDLAASMRFYTDVLGFIVSERWTEGDVLKGVMLKAGACTLGLSQDDWKKGRDREKGQGVRLWCVTVQDVDALAARIKKAGGVLADGPSDEPWGGRSLSVADPDGYKITIYREA
jgi:catechol 2,3-dioxygenase-like lactoylglutathione lyase family enzyme